MVLVLGFLYRRRGGLPETARTAAVAPVVDVVVAPVVLRTSGGDDGMRRGTAERMARSESSGASWNGDG